jgi:hypothetical protein
MLLPEPGQTDTCRSAPASFISAAALGRCIAVAWMALLLLPACASDRTSTHPDLAAVWRDFVEMPSERAMAIAGDPRRDRWVIGASGGHATRDEATAEALRECQKRRGARRMQAACVLYAVGDEIVWRGR